MALQAPQYNGPGMGQASFVPQEFVPARGFAHADANAFGAAEAREAGQFARRGLNASLDVLAAAQEQQRRCDTAVVKNATNQARIEMLNGMTDLMSLRGANAQDVPEKTNALFQSVMQKYSPLISGGNIERQEMFNQSMGAMRDDYYNKGMRHYVGQMRQFEQDSLDLEITAVEQEIGVFSEGKIPSTATGDTSVAVDENKRVYLPTNYGEEMAGRIIRVRDDVALMLAGRDPALVAQVQDDAEVRLHVAAISALSKNNPLGALEYLNQPEVRGIMPAKVYEASMKTVSGLVEMVSAGEDAERAFAEMSPEDARLRAFNEPRYQANQKAQRLYLEVLDANNERAEEQKKAERIQGIASLTEQAVAVGGKAGRLSPENQRLLMLDEEAYTKFKQVEEVMKRIDAGNLAPDEAFYEKMEIEEIRNPGAWRRWLLEDSVRPGGKEAELVEKLGGNKTRIDRVLSLAQKEPAGAGNGGGGGANVSAAFSFGDSFEGMWPMSAFDGDERKDRKNGFIAMGNQLVADAEANIFKRKATRQEKEDIAQQLYRDIEDGKIDVSLPYFKQTEQYLQLQGRAAAGGAAAGRIEIDVDAFLSTAHFSERRHNHGEDVVNLSPAIGAVAQNFGNIRPDDTRQLPPSIISVKATEVLRAYASGKIAGIAYAPEDFLVYDRAGMLRIFDPEGVQKGGRIKEAVSTDRAATVEAAEAAEMEGIAAAQGKQEELNALLNSRENAVRELEQFKRTAGNSIAAQRAVARREETIERMDRGIRAYQGENVNAEIEAELRMQEIARLTRERAEVAKEGERIAGGARMPGALIKQNKRRLAELNAQIAKLQEAMQ